MLLLFREREGEEEWQRERESEADINVREKHTLVASLTHSDWGSKLKPRDVPSLGIKLPPFDVMGNALTN